MAPPSEDVLMCCTLLSISPRTNRVGYEFVALTHNRSRGRGLPPSHSIKVGYELEAGQSKGQGLPFFFASAGACVYFLRDLCLSQENRLWCHGRLQGPCTLLGRASLPGRADCSHVPTIVLQEMAVPVWKLTALLPARVLAENLTASKRTW